MNPLISVIVPVYKAEKYLDKCVQSIVNQTYKNLEIILVDDGSPDNCPEMCDEWAKKDSRIKVIHKENSGAASARNAALDIALGDYIGFVDSDDYIEPNMLDELYDSMQSNGADISICANDEVDENYNFIKENKVPSDEFVITPYDCFLNIYGANYAHCIIPNKLYKKEIWQDIRFPHLGMCEDEAVLPYIYQKAEKIAVVNEALYHYYIEHVGSVMNKEFSEDTHLIYISILEERFDLFKSLQMEDVYINTAVEYVLRLRGAYLSLENNNSQNSGLKKNLLKKYRKAFKTLIGKNQLFKIVGIKKYFMLRLFCLSPALYKTVVKILGCIKGRSVLCVI